MKQKIDKKDWKILYELDCDARQSFSEIAKNVGLSKEVVNYRMKQLEKRGIIKGYYALINMSKLGYVCNRFFIKLKNSSPQEQEKIIEYFVKHSKYWWVNSCDGFRDMGIGSWEKTIEDCHKRKEELMTKFKPFLDEVEQSIYTKFTIYKRAYLANKRNKETERIEYITEEKEKIDEMDRKILQEIAENARIPVIELAKKCNTTVAVVNYRIRNMRKKGIIEGYRAILDLNKIGYYWYKIEFMLKDYTKKQAMLNYFATHPNIVYAYESTGKADLEVEIEVKSYEKFREVLNELRTHFADAIETYKHLLWFKEHKIIYFEKDKVI